MEKMSKKGKVTEIPQEGRSLEQLRRDNGLHKKEPNLLTGEGMTYSTRFRDNLRGRAERGFLQKTFRRSTTSR